MTDNLVKRLRAFDWRGKVRTATAHEAADRIEALHEKLAAAYIALSGTDVHASDCATSNAPAYEPGPCDCKGAEQ